jgi:hypothetical protein
MGNLGRGYATPRSELVGYLGRHRNVLFEKILQAETIKTRREVAFLLQRVTVEVDLAVLRGQGDRAGQPSAEGGDEVGPPGVGVHDAHAFPSYQVGVAAASSYVVLVLYLDVEGGYAGLLKPRHVRLAAGGREGDVEAADRQALTQRQHRRKVATPRRVVVNHQNLGPGDHGWRPSSRCVKGTA